MNKILCVIGVRGGSKRLPHKNIQKYGDTTLLEWAITNAQKSKYINTIIVDTEDNQMLEIARNRIGVITHQREPSLSEDDVSLYTPVKQVLNDYPTFKTIVIMQVDNPVDSPETIDYCIKTFLDHPDAEEVSTFHNNRRTGTIRVIKRNSFFSCLPTANIYSVEDRPDFVDIHTQQDLSLANQNLKQKTEPHDTFQISNKIREPIEYNTHMIHNHFKRYHDAIKNLDIRENDVVMDASCGQGYGTYILSKYCKKTWGLDVNEKHIEKAKQYYPNIDYDTYNNWDKTWTEMKPIINKIVCIETIEHIPKTELSDFILRLYKYIKIGGDLFITAPLGHDEPSEYNPHHLNEPSMETLKNLFSPYFKKMVIEKNCFINSFNKKSVYCMISLFGFGENG